MEENGTVGQHLARDGGAAKLTDVLDSLVEGEVGLGGLAPVLEDILAGRVRGRMLVRPGA